MYYHCTLVLAGMPRLTLFFSLLAGVFASPLQGGSPMNLTQSFPIPIPSSLLRPPKPINPVNPNSPPNPLPPAQPDPVCSITLGEPNLGNCLAAAALIPRDPRDNPILRNFYVRESDRNASMENIKVPYEKTVGELIV